MSENKLSDKEVKIRVDEATKVVEDSLVLMERHKALVKLKGMKEFGLVFEDGYFGDYAQHIFRELTNPPQFAVIPLKDCEDTLSGIKALKAYIGFEANVGKVEQEAQMALVRMNDAQAVLDAIG